MSLTQAELEAETWSEKGVRKFKENPFVPLGCLGTLASLYMATAKFSEGNSRAMNYWLRWRVGVQGFTLVALVIGSVTMQRKRRAEQEALLAGQSQVQSEGESIAGERAAFEERLKDAEAVQAEEDAARLNYRNTKARQEMEGRAHAEVARRAQVQEDARKVPSIRERGDIGMGRLWWSTVWNRGKR